MMYTMIADALLFFVVFFFNDTATTEIYTYGHTLSLHDALPISMRTGRPPQAGAAGPLRYLARPIAFSTLALSVSDCSMNLAKSGPALQASPRSEEHTSELQSLMRTSYAGFCLKKKKTTINTCH